MDGQTPNSPYIFICIIFLKICDAAGPKGRLNHCKLQKQNPKRCLLNSHLVCMPLLIKTPIHQITPQLLHNVLHRLFIA